MLRIELEKIAEEEFDLVVIGGGITGAGIALDAISRGIKTLLVEKRDFASGTSSKSTKLIHGGLRYLKQLEFKLVADVGRERAIVHHLAPHLVHPTKMLLPFTQKGQLGKFSTSMALSVYDFLANVESKDKKQMLGTQKALKREPLLQSVDISGAGYYAEYRTDDARLTIELIKKAIDLGARCVNYCEVTNIIQENNQATGVEILDHISNKAHSIKSKLIVNATGPWVDTVRRTQETIKGKKLVLTKGVHLVVPHEVMPVQQPLYFDTADGRMIFAIPRLNITYIGTSDTKYYEDIDEVYATEEDVNYLIESVNVYFRKDILSKKDINSTWAGLRPLIHEDGKSPSELSRKDEIFVSANGMLSIAGGKLTGYRTMSKRIVDLVADKLNNASECKTKELKYTNNPFSSYDQVQKVINQLSKNISTDLDQTLEAEYLVSNYGKDAKEIIQESKNAAESDAESLLIAELNYCLANEMVMNSEDFWIRRTGRIYFRIDSVHKYKQLVHDKISEFHNWSSNQKTLDLKNITEELNKTLGFKYN